MRLLVTGATGYIGGRLVPHLLAARHAVRVGVREPARVAGRRWAADVDVAPLDVTRPGSLAPALDGIDAAYYLIHSMQDTTDFAARDAQAARDFAEAAAAAGVRHVIYLGGLQPKGVTPARVSTHLQSRAEVGRILAASVPTTEFRAGPIIGSGSASFEMTRYLTERLPAMVAPRWILTKVSPIGVRDVVQYLVAAADKPAAGVVDVGSAPLPFRDMMHQYAQARGLRRRLIVPVPVLTPHLAGLWVQLVTPIPNRLAVPIIKGIVFPLPADTRRARELFPRIVPMPYSEAVRAALTKLDERGVETRWSDAMRSGADHRLVTREGLIQEVQRVSSPAAPADVFARAAALGGEAGWPWNWAWRLRGGLDRLVGGPGLRRGRRDPLLLRTGEALDFWRVEAFEPERRILLRAEMKIPGRAWLQWEIEPTRDGSRVVQSALFAPKGLAGVLYWYLLYPLHRPIFRAMALHVAGVRRGGRRGSSRQRRNPGPTDGSAWQAARAGASHQRSSQDP